MFSLILDKQADVDGGLVISTRKFKYLGSYLTSDLSDATEGEENIKSASAAFASLRQQFFSSKDSMPEPMKDWSLAYYCTAVERGA